MNLLLSVLNICCLIMWGSVCAGQVSPLTHQIKTKENNKNLALSDCKVWSLKLNDNEVFNDSLNWIFSVICDVTRDILYIDLEHTL